MQMKKNILFGISFAEIIKMFFFPESSVENRSVVDELISQNVPLSNILRKRNIWNLDLFPSSEKIV
jgi:hypothetical protein